MASKGTPKVAERMSVEAFTRQFILSARGDFAGVNTVITKHNGYNFNQWYRSYHGRGLLEATAPESPVDATQALQKAGKLVIGRSKKVGVYIVLPEDSVQGSNQGERKSAIDALMI